LIIYRPAQDNNRPAHYPYFMPSPPFSAPSLCEEEEDFSGSDTVYEGIPKVFMPVHRFLWWFCCFCVIDSWISTFLLRFFQVHNVNFAFELMQDAGLAKPKARPEGTDNKNK
jgi:hypothetical protein